MTCNYAATESQESPVGSIGTVFLQLIQILARLLQAILLFSMAFVCLYGDVMAKVHKPMRTL